MLMQHVLQDFNSPHGFLRRRACWMYGTFGEFKDAFISRYNNQRKEEK